ncbi:MAG: DUF2791 family P-loop domain-containing protein [Ilumatobacteraceae bacterium]
MISAVRRREIVDALRRGTVPQRGLDALPSAPSAFATAVGNELDTVAAGGAHFKAIRGEWGSGKTFTVRWIAEHARLRGFATAEVQISEGETHSNTRPFTAVQQSGPHHRRTPRRAARCAPSLTRGSRAQRRRSLPSQ